MSAFENREKAFEAKYHFDEEIAFKVNARRDKLLGLWVAEKLGLVGSEAEDYARSVLESDLVDPEHKTMLLKLQKDLELNKIDVDADKLYRQFDRFFADARDQIIAEIADGKLTVSPE